MSEIAVIGAQLDALRAENKAGVENICERLELLEGKVGRLDAVLRGEGASPGMVLRVDRLEQSEANRARLLWVVAAASASGLIAAISKWIAG